MSQRFFDPALRIWRSGLRRDASWSVLSFGVYASLGAVQSVAIARHLGPEGKGLVTLLTLAPTVTGWALSLGFTNANMYLSAARPGQRNGLLTMSAVAAVILGAAAAVVAWTLFGRDLDGDPRVPFLVAVTLIPVLLVSEFQSGVLVGAGHVVAFSKAAISARVISVTGIVAAVYVLERSVALFAVPLALAAGYVIIAAVSWRLMRWHRRWDLAALREELRFGLRGHLGGISEIGLLRLDQLVVFGLLGAAPLGLYSVAVLLGESLTLLGQALATSAFSRMATYEPDAARALALRISALVLAVTSLAAVPLALGAGIITTALFGPGFAPATPLVGILALAGAFQATGRVGVAAIRARARPLLSSGVYVVGLAVTLPLVFLLVPQLGIEGAAIASLAGYTSFAVAAIGALHPAVDRIRLSWAR